MAVTSSSTGLLLLLLSVILAASVVSARRIDCTRFVFAPRCRGVAAKRGGHSLSVEDTTELDDTFTDSVLGMGEANRDEDSEKFLRLLLDLSRAIRQPITPSARGKELLERLLRS
uniref:Elevenin n=1 Tax=Charonia tritonis TaxID=1960912 RepID=A0A1S6JQ53_9CAEN|nr:Elevenin precursor [Charonia tritonis]